MTSITVEYTGDYHCKAVHGPSGVSNTSAGGRHARSPTVMPGTPDQVSVRLCRRPASST